MHLPFDSRPELETRCVEQTKRRIAALEQCGLSDGAFEELDQWDAAARAHLRHRLRSQAEAYLKHCLSYEPRVCNSLVEALRAPQTLADNVTAIRPRGAHVLRATSLNQALCYDLALRDVAAKLARAGVETFAELEDAGQERLLAIGVTLAQIEMLDRACASGGLRMKAT